MHSSAFEERLKIVDMNCADLVECFFEHWHLRMARARRWVYTECAKDAKVEILA